MLQAIKWLLFGFGLQLCCAQMQIYMDNAGVRLISNQSDVINATLFGRSLGCYRCVPQVVVTANRTNEESDYALVNTFWGWEFELQLFLSSGSTNKSSVSFHPGERGGYSLMIAGYGDNVTAYWVTDERPINTYEPLIIAVALGACLAVLYPLSLFFYRKLHQSHKRFSLTNYEVDMDAESARKKPRLSSLDVFRGMCLTIMIFVNYGGGGYWFFNHSLWNGLTVADLVFPWFIFIMGVAIPLSFSAMLKKDVPRSAILKKTIRRSIILFALGLFVNNGAHLSEWRVPGVLQRFGIAYMITSLIILFVPTLSTESTKGGLINEQADYRAPEAEQLLSRTKVHTGSFLPFALQWIVAVSLVIVYLLITFLVHDPNCPKGYLGPGGIGDDGLYPTCTGGAARYIDFMILGNSHMYSTPTCQWMYQTPSFDPEGILGNLTSIFLCFLGSQAGRIFQMHPTPKSRLARLIPWGVGFASLATLLCKASQNDGWIPINKNLWSPSFVFLLGGLGFLVLALCYCLVDVWQVWNGAPFLYAGMNAIILYVGSETLQNYFPFSFYTEYSYTSHALSLTSNIVGVSS